LGTMKIEKVRVMTDEVVVIIDGRGRAWVPVTALCRLLGLKEEWEKHRLRSLKWAHVAKINGIRRDGLPVESIPADRVAQWLVTVDANKLDPRFRAKLESFQEHLGPAIDRWLEGSPLEETLRDAGLYARRNIEPDVVREHVLALQKMGGRCPACGVTPVVDAHGIVRPAEKDHFAGRWANGTLQVWIICKDCHDQKTDAMKRGEVMFLVEFIAFQNKRQRWSKPTLFPVR
jgi:hypothetical protein